MLAFFLALRLTLDARSASTPLHVPRAKHIEFDITLRHAATEHPDEPVADFENHDPHYFDHRPAPNVSIRVVRITGNERVPVAIRVFSSGISGGADSDSQHIEMMIPASDREARLGKMLQCFGATNNDAMRRYIEAGIVDSEPGTYEITASYGANAITSAPLRVIVDDGVDMYQQLCASRRQ